MCVSTSFIRDLFRTRENSVKYVAPDEQHPNILIKALSREYFQYHCKRLMNISELGILVLDGLFEAVNVSAHHPRQACFGLSWSLAMSLTNPHEPRCGRLITRRLRVRNPRG